MDNDVIMRTAALSKDLRKCKDKKNCEGWRGASGDGAAVAKVLILTNTNISHSGQHGASHLQRVRHRLGQARLERVSPQRLLDIVVVACLGLSLRFWFCRPVLRPRATWSKPSSEGP